MDRLGSDANRCTRWTSGLALALLLQAGPAHFHAAADLGSATAAVSAATASNDASIDPADCPTCRTGKQPRTTAPLRARGSEPAFASQRSKITPFTSASARRFLRAPAPPRAPPA